MAPRIRVALASTVTALLIAAIALVGAAPASASMARAVQISPDGTSYSGTWNGTLFGDVALVPTASAQKSFWVRNASSEAAYVRITLAQVVVHDVEFGDALTVSASMPGWPGSPVVVTAAQPCYVLAQGPVLPSGGTTRVDARMLLGDLSGLAGQRGTVTYSLRVTLSSASLASLPPTSCPANGADVIGYIGDPRVTPIPGRAIGGSDAGTTPLGVGDGTGGGTAIDDPAAVPGDTDVPVIRASAVTPNTGRLWQELDVMFWLLLAVAGALVALRRRKDSMKGAAP